MSYRLAAVAIVSALGFAPAAAEAQTAVVVPETTVLVPARPVTALDAREIAAMHGVGRVESIDLNRWAHQWEIDGRDFAGRYVEMDIDSNTGTVLRLDR
jgi:hypothetical protein